MAEMQGTGNAAVVNYCKFPVTKQIRYDRQSFSLGLYCHIRWGFVLYPPGEVVRACNKGVF